MKEQVYQSVNSLLPQFMPMS